MLSEEAEFFVVNHLECIAELQLASNDLKVLPS